MSEYIMQLGKRVREGNYRWEEKKVQIKELK